jgi:tetratricopeptide (TPR) repeat protein
MRRGSTVLALLLAGLSSPAWGVGPFEANPPEVERGLKAFDEGKYEESLKAFEAAERAAPNHPALEYNRGNALYRLGRFDEARAAYRRAAETAGTSLKERDLYNMGNALAELGDTPGAITAYRRALVLEPRDEAARHNLEVLLRKLPPPKSQSGDGGTDGGRPDGGPQDGGQDGGSGDGGQSGDAGTQKGDAGTQRGDGGTGDGGTQAGQQGLGAGEDGGTDAGPRPEEADGGAPRPEFLQDAGVGRSSRFDQGETERLLDAMKQNERNLQLWRFQQRKKPRKPDEKDW